MHDIRTPHCSVDIIIRNSKRQIVLIERKFPPPGFALPGGFVEIGETLEQAAVREAKEETCLDVRLLGQFHTYSDPKRDPRFHTVSTVFLAEAEGKPCGADDAKTAQWFDLRELPKLAFDHGQILTDYIEGKYIS